MRVLGAVLAGGASRRMGTPKALLELGPVLEPGGQALAARVAGALAAAGAERVVLVGGDAAWAEALGLGVVPDRWPGAGPLAGTATALSVLSGSGGEPPVGVGRRHHRTGAGAADGGAAGPDRAVGIETIVVVAACDQPDLTPRALAALVDALVGAPPDVRAAAPRTPDGRRHPFPSAWRLAAAPMLVGLVEGGARRAGAAFDAVGVVDAAVDDAALVDLDTPEDVRRWANRRPPPP